MKKQLPFALLFLCGLGQAQPLFRLNSETLCQGDAPLIEVLAPNIYSSYFWDMGNGVTGTGYQPPVTAYPATGQFPIQLTVMRNSPFSVIDSMTILQTSNNWMSTSIFCGNDGAPDYYLRLSDMTGKFYLNTPYNYETVAPSAFPFSGLLTQKSIQVSVYDKDFSLGCQPDDYLGNLTIPGGAVTTVYENTAAALRIRTNIKSVTTTKYTFLLTVMPKPELPVVACRPSPLPFDTLYCDNLGENLQWLDANMDPIAGATQQVFVPTKIGTYFVRYSPVGSCQVVSQPFRVPQDCDAMVSTGEGPDLQALQCVPNPVTDICRIFSTQMEGKMVGLTVQAANGPFVLQWKGAFPGNGLLVDLTEAALGVYFVSLSSGGQVLTKKIVRL